MKKYFIYYLTSLDSFREERYVASIKKQRPILPHWATGSSFLGNVMAKDKKSALKKADSLLNPKSLIAGF